MQSYEYKVVPAPAKGKKGPGVKGADGRFAHGLETTMNALAAEGWEYLRADILPSEERQGLTSTQTVYRSVLVFRRKVETAVAESPAPLPWDSPEATDDIDQAEEALTLAEETEAPDAPPSTSATEEDQQTRL